MFRGQVTRARRVLEIGKPYYWKQNTLPNEDETLNDLWAWASAQGLGHCNSILVNIYDEKSSYIGWHSDKTTKLLSPIVSSFSFAINPQDEGKILAEMEFSKNFPTINLRDKTRVDFDAVKHAELGVQHRVRRTICP